MTEIEPKAGIPVILQIACTLWVLFLFIGLLLILNFDPATVGQFGDFFGVFNCLLSSLAVAGAIYAVILQQNQFNAAAKREKELADIQAVSAYSQCLASCASFTFEKYKDLQEKTNSFELHDVPDLSGLPDDKAIIVVENYMKLIELQRDNLGKHLKLMAIFHESANTLNIQLTDALLVLREFPSVASKIPHPPESVPDDSPE